MRGVNGRLAYALVLLGLTLLFGASWALEVLRGGASPRGQLPSARLALLAAFLLGYLVFGYALAREGVPAGIPFRAGMGLVLALPVAWLLLV